MPIYEYRCSKCQGEFEDFRGMNDPDPKECPKCGPAKLERLISVPNIGYKNRPVWTYSDVKKYKTMTQDGVTMKVDPSKHGSPKSLPGKVIKDPKKK